LKTIVEMLPLVIYVVDIHGIIRHVFNSQFRTSRHVKEAIEQIKKMD